MATTDYIVPVPVLPGLRYQIVLPWNWTTFGLGIAGKIADVELVRHRCPGRTYHRAEVWIPGRDVSFPMFLHEAGLYETIHGDFYCYEIPDHPSELLTGIQIE